MAGKRPNDWRAGIRSFHGESPIKRYLRVTGGSAGQPLVGRPVRACSDVVRAGWRPVGPDGQEELDSG
jgi:hypothetical protein